MSGRDWILMMAFATFPTPLAGQMLDSARAYELAIQVAEDLRSLEPGRDIRYIHRSLVETAAFFGIEFELPAGSEPLQEKSPLHVDEIYRGQGADGLLEAAARFDEEWPGGRWRLLALARIAHLEGPEVALEAARERGLLEAAFHQVLRTQELARIDEILAWLAETDLAPDLRLRLRAQTLAFGSVFEPFRFWRRADSLPEPYRTQVRAWALSSKARTDTIPLVVLEVELPRMATVAETLTSTESAVAKQAVVRTCARRRINSCADLDLSVADLMRQAGAEVIEFVGSGAFKQANDRLEQLRLTQPPLVLARWMVQGLGAVERNCRMVFCDLVQLDSLASTWLDEILSVEADAIAGRSEGAATWSGMSDLTALQGALGRYLSARDLDATRALLGRIKDQKMIRDILPGLISAAPDLDLVGAVEIYLEYATDGDEPPLVYYWDLLTAGRPDLAEEMLRRASSSTATRARVNWVLRLSYARRLNEAQAALRVLMAEATYRDPVGDGQLLNVVQRLRMLDEYLAHVRALPTPLQRLNGICPLLSEWVRLEQSKARRLN